MQVLGQLDSFREALPGEFTKRALMNGKMDLIQAEGLSDIINAESEEQMNLGLMQLQGKHSQTYAQLKKKLIKMLAAVEAYIDFDADETNQVGEVMQPVRAQC